MQLLGTFLKDGDCLTGIICTSTTQARLTFRPDVTNPGAFTATIGGQRVGYAEPRFSGDDITCYAVRLHPDILPSGRIAALVPKGCVYVLSTCR